MENRSETTAEGLQDLGHQPQRPVKAIREFCLACSAGSEKEVRYCLLVKCPLYPFRMGKNPWRQPPSEAQRESARQALADRRARSTQSGA